MKATDFNLLPLIYTLDKELSREAQAGFKGRKAAHRLKGNPGHTALTNRTTGGGAGAERSGKGGKTGGGMGGQQAGGIKGGGKRKTHAGSK